MSGEPWNPYTDGDPAEDPDQHPDPTEGGEGDDEEVVPEDIYDDLIRRHAEKMSDPMKRPTMTVLTTILAERVAGTIYRSALDPDEFLETLETRVRRILKSKGVEL